MENDTDIVEIIKQAVEECQVEVATEHLLKGILPQHCETPYILVTKPSDNELILSPNSEANTSEGSSLGGSPLKLKNYYVGKDSATISRTGIAYKACTIDEARKILSVYQLESQSNSVSHPILPLWVLCDKNDPQGIVALSSHTRKRQQDTYTFNSHVVTIKGPFTENDVTSELNTVLKNISHGADENSQRLDINCSAIYSVFGALGSKDISADQIQTASSTMSIHLTWNKFSTTLVPPRDARAKVAVTVVAGDERSAAISRYRELVVLLELIKGVEKNEIHWTAECTDAAPLQRVSKLLEDMKSGNQGLSSEEGDGSDSPTPATLSTLHRKDLDFTEEMWIVLKDCTSNRELVECFKYIFNCLNSGQIQPMVHRTNKTTLAELVRDSFQRNMVIPSLEGAGAVNILIDMGIEKLTRDYIGTFIGKELVTLNHLGFFMTSNKKLSFAQRAERLERLHYVLELVVLLDQFVNVHHPTLSMCSRQALEYYEQHSVEPHHEFTIPLQTNLVSGYIENCKPSEHKVIMKKHFHGHESCSVVQLSSQPPVGLTNEAASAERSDEHCSYYLTTVTQNVTSL